MGRAVGDRALYWSATCSEKKVATFRRTLFYSHGPPFQAPVGQAVQGTDRKKSFVAEVAVQYGRRLHRFLAARLRNAGDAPDLAQEVYLRLLRVEKHELIRNPEAYMFTVASHLLNEHTLRQSAAPVVVDLGEIFTELHTLAEHDPAEQVERQQRVQDLEHAMRRLPAKAQVALLLHRRDGYTLDEVAERLGVSRAMAKKYLARALVHCQRRLEREGELGSK